MNEARPPVLPVPTLGADEPPFAVLVDFDGTIALTDVSDTVMAAHVPSAWQDLVALYDAGTLGSRRLIEWEVGQLPDDPAPLIATAVAQPHDPSFVAFVAAARGLGVPVEVVSDGLGFFIGPTLDRLSLGDLPVATPTVRWRSGGRPEIEFTFGNPRCGVCGTCKRDRVLAHRAAGRAVVFVGDGESDRYAAGYADVVFAKDALVRICRANGWPYLPWGDFRDVERWLVTTVDAWRSDPDDPRVPRPAARPAFCGPEVWGDPVPD